MLNILHIGTACHFTEGMTYQDNLLSEQNVNDGHNVTYISNCAKYIDGKLAAVPPEDTILPNGLRLIRVPFVHIVSPFISEKFRKSKNLKALLEEIRPDVILFHGCCAWDLQVVAKYKKKHPNIKLYADSHADFRNSARNWISKNLFHRMFYKSIIQSVYASIDKIFYISLESKDFLTNLYKLPEDKLEFYPLGGLIPSQENKTATCEKIRQELNLSDSDILLVHSGKMDALKRTTVLLRAFSKVDDARMKMVLLGSLPKETRLEIEALVNADSRVAYKGWANADTLQQYLCACDVYLQPGSQSATMQNAMCCGASVMLYPHKSHSPFLKDNGWFVETEDDMYNAFLEISRNPEILAAMGENSSEIARDILDYRKLAARLYK